MFRRLLVAVDGSAHAERALVEAIDLAQATHGTLTLLTVVADPSGWALSGMYLVSVDAAGLAQETMAAHARVLERAIGRVPQCVSVTRLLIHGSPGPAIVEQAERGAHDLIVMGSRGRSEVGSLVLGSVSHHVVHGSAIPVLICHGEPSAGG